MHDHEADRAAFLSWLRFAVKAVEPLTRIPPGQPVTHALHDYIAEAHRQLVSHLLALESRTTTTTTAD